jgi:recombinational DNA repair protein RecR
VTYLLIPADKENVSATSFLFQGAQEVEVCNECGTVHSPRFFCPTCSLRGRDE